MTMTDRNDDMLEDVFADARDIRPQVSDDLMSRVLADAARVQHSEPLAQSSFWERLYDMMGGWPVMGGLATATIAGFWLGLTPPAALDDLTARLTGDTVNVTLVADAAWLGFEDEFDG